MDPKPLIIAHHNCADGFTSVWLANQFFHDPTLARIAEELVVDYHPGVYGELPPLDVKDRDVYILDFSYPAEQTKEIAEKAKSVTVIDHHETAIRKLMDRDWTFPENTRLILDTTRSGAYLTSKYFWPDREPMTMVKLVDDRDRWVFADARTRPFHASLFSRPYKIGEWNRLRDNLSAAVNEGVAIERKQAKDIDELLAQTARLMKHGEMVLACANMSYMQASDAGHKMLEQYPGIDFAATFFVRKDNRIVFSLRSRKDGVNVAQIAESFGGGGHANAAGFTRDHIPFLPA